MTFAESSYYVHRVRDFADGDDREMSLPPFAGGLPATLVLQHAPKVVSEHVLLCV